MKYQSVMLAGCLALAAATTMAHAQTREGASLQTYVIERDLPGAGKLSAAELQAIARRSNGVLAGMGPGIQWVESYVSADKIYCVYRAQSEAAIRSHAQAGGFPANRISRITSVMNPTTAR
jgi:hypothetical protein